MVEMGFPRNPQIILRVSLGLAVKNRDGWAIVNTNMFFAIK